MPLRVSVIIVSFNEERFIRDCVSSVLDQDFPRQDYEVIVVDNASKDRTPQIVRDEFPSVKLAPASGNLGLPAGMNEGLKHAQAPRVVMLACDTCVPRTWLAALMRPMDEDPTVKVTHAAMVIPGDPNYEENLKARATPSHAAYHEMSRLSLIEPHWVPTTAAPVPTLHVAGASAAFDTSILPELGGYMLDNDFFLDCDEVDFGFRVNSLGYKVLAVPAAAYYHRNPFNTKMTFSRPLIRRLRRLQRNKALCFYKNMHTLEFLACLPLYLFGGALKPLVYGERFSIVQRIAYSLGLEAFVWLGFLTAVFGWFPRFADKRRISLKNRRRPPFWFFKQLMSRPALENKAVPASLRPALEQLHG
ncbi:MAG: glycosyltransferase family 2 protein [Chloroflexi bacterium]|nr:glycosyltransferase family 2 protein [Chloroflexota bacterium]